MQNFLGGTYSQNEAIEELAAVYRANGLKDNQRAARDSWRRIIKVEEIRNNVEDQLISAKSSTEKERLRSKLKNIYETQVYGLNPVFSIFGTAQEVK
jgi:hypothetical protein